GAAGSKWYDGFGVPSAGLGIDDDYYLDNNTGDVYGKSAGAWSAIANIQGPAGSGGGTPSYYHVKTVAVSGGDYNSIVNALAAITDNSASNPYLIRVMPGAYPGFTMKPYVRIQGAGSDQCRIMNPITGADHATLDGFLLNGLVTCDGVSPTISNCATTVALALVKNYASPRIINNDVSLPTTSSVAAISVETGSTPEVIDNIIRINGTNTSLTGIKIVNGSGGRYIGNKLVGLKFWVYGTSGLTPDLGASNPVIMNNEVVGPNYGVLMSESNPVILNNNFKDIWMYGIYITNSNPVVQGNRIQAGPLPAGTSTGYIGIYVSNSAGKPARIANNVMQGITDVSYMYNYGIRVEANCEPVLVNNIITGHATDVYVPYVGPKLVFNVFDTISGNGGDGNYNTTSAGATIAVP
ncbi:hypothetical protein HZA56_02830, partial [Candidatus Poribacteria bacterium]|nr:hypothetical protein [Candidatus Poribacteria bacterium]